MQARVRATFPDSFLTFVTFHPICNIVSKLQTPPQLLSHTISVVQKLERNILT